MTAGSRVRIFRPVQPRRTRYMRIVTIIVLMAVMLILMSGVIACKSAPPIEEAVVCAGINRDGSPRLPAVSFSPDVKTIYCSVKLASVASSSTVRGEWYIVKSEAAGIKEYAAGGETVKAERPYLVFAFERAEQLLPVGDYEIRLTYDNRQRLVVPFKIQGEVTDTSTKLSDGIICSSIDTSTDRPLDKWETVPDNARVVFCSAKVTGADFGTVIKASWMLLKDGKETSNVIQASTRVEGRKYVSFSIQTAGGKKLLKGDYQVKLFVNDIAQVTVPFKVVDSAELPGPYLSEAGTLVLGGSENKTVQMSNSFPADVEVINFRTKANNCPQGTSVGIKWIVIKTAEGDVLDHVLKEETVQVEGTAEVYSAIKRTSDKFPRGEYAVKALINGEEKITVPFRVR
jgi:hypothetical protein